MTDPAAPAFPSTSVEAFVRRLPKAELHLHIEGTLEPELLLELGRRNGVPLPCSSAEECRAQYRFSDLQHFLEHLLRGRGRARDGAGLPRSDHGLRAPRRRGRRPPRGGVLRPAEPRAARRAVRRRGRRHHQCAPRRRDGARRQLAAHHVLPARPAGCRGDGDARAGAAPPRRHRGRRARLGRGRPPAGRRSPRCTRRPGRRASSPSRTPARRARPRTSPRRSTYSRCAASTTGSPPSRTPRLQRRLAGRRYRRSRCARSATSSCR